MNPAAAIDHPRTGTRKTLLLARNRTCMGRFASSTRMSQKLSWFATTTKLRPGSRRSPWSTRTDTPATASSVRAHPRANLTNQSPLGGSSAAKIAGTPKATVARTMIGQTITERTTRTPRF
jgi:hypothetical protein